MAIDDKSAFGYDDPNRGPLDRTANAVTGGTGGVSGAMDTDDRDRSLAGNGSVVSAMFDSEAEAERAVSELRQIGVNDSDLSLIAQSKGTMTTREGGGEVTGEEHSSILRGILGGGALGAGLGVAALAIPGVGPLAALGAIAASAVPEAVAIGAVAGAAVGTFNETLKTGAVDAQQAQDTLYRNGGHSSSRARTAAI
jgi:hypothetical protein